MNHYIWVEVKTKYQERVLLKLFKGKINVFEVQYGKEKCQFKILESDYGKLKKIVGYQFRKVKDDGIFHLKNILRTKWLILIGICFFFCCSFLLSHIIVDIDVIHSNKEIRLLVSKALENHGIKRLTWKKNFNDIASIKESILNEYPEDLEWLEIEVVGMKYIVRIEERIITKENVKKERCHLVATKSAIVKKMNYSVGDAKVTLNDFVSEGDILVSGELIANEKVTGIVCATGNVYGEVWYTTKVSLPLEYEVKKEAKKKRWNFIFSNGAVDHYVLRPRLNQFVDEKKRLFSILGWEIYFTLQKEVEIEKKVYEEAEALERALQLVDEKFQMRLKEEESILDKKVLKKSVNDSTMDIEVFVSLIEHISRQEEFQGELEEGY